MDVRINHLPFLQMFTDFISECRAHKAQVQATKKNEVMGTAKVQPFLTLNQTEAPRRVAATA